jgi:hypothetical protein
MCLRVLFIMNKAAQLNCSTADQQVVKRKEKDIVDASGREREMKNTRKKSGLIHNSNILC